MTRKLAVIAVAFDDPEDDIQDTSDMATWVQTALGIGGVDVTVYSSPEALVADTAEVNSVFSEGRQGTPVPHHEDRKMAVPGA